jgi:hypothetical protein
MNKMLIRLDQHLLFKASFYYLSHKRNAMNYDAASRYPSPAQILTPIYIEAGLFATLQKEGRVAEYIALNSRPSEKSILENFASIATANHSPPAPLANAEATLSGAESIINSSKHVPVQLPEACYGP